MPQRPVRPRPLPGMAAVQPPNKLRAAMRSRSASSELESLLALQLRAMHLPAPVREHRFHPVRKWRFDFAWPDRMLAMEVDGGGFVAGRHGRGMGIEGDAEKASAAAILGWRVMRCTGSQIKSGQAIRWLWDALGGSAAVRPTEV